MIQFLLSGYLAIGVIWGLTLLILDRKDGSTGEERFIFFLGMSVLWPLIAGNLLADRIRRDRPTDPADSIDSSAPKS